MINHKYTRVLHMHATIYAIIKLSNYDFHFQLYKYNRNSIHYFFAYIIMIIILYFI